MHKHLAHRYSRALISAATDAASLPVVEQDIRKIWDLFSTNPEMRGLLERSSKIPELASEISQDMIRMLQPCQLVQDFIQLLFEKKRLGVLFEISVEFIRLRKKAVGLVSAKATSFRELSIGERNEISNRISGLIKSNLEIEWIVDSAVLGGIRLQIGNDIFDGTLDSRIRSLQEQLIED